MAAGGPEAKSLSVCPRHLGLPLNGLLVGFVVEYGRRN